MNKKKETMEGTNKEVDEQTKQRSNERQRGGNRQRFQGTGDQLKIDGASGSSFKFVKCIKEIN